MWISDKWRDYELIDCSNGEKLERWGNYTLVRPDPQAIWHTARRDRRWQECDGRYARSHSGGGAWDKHSLPASWQISYGDLRFNVKPMNFKHTGIFPEQAANWDFIMRKIRSAGREISVLNLFAYTGAATVAVMPRLFDRAEASAHGRRWLGAGLLGFALVLLLYVLLWPKRAGNVAEFDAHGVESAWTLFGTMLGLLAAWYADRCWLHFDTRAVWWAQALKLVLGLALVMGVRVGLKAALAALFGEAPFADGVRYLCIALAGGVLWPMTFGFWSRLGRKRVSQPHE